MSSSVASQLVTSPEAEALAGKDSPSADDIKKILESVESEYVAASEFCCKESWGLNH